MYVVPIFTKTINSIDTALLQQIWMLLERNGTFCTYVETVEDALAYATENEIPLQGAPIVVESVIYLPVDGKSSALDLFYTWNETRTDEQPMRAVWRPFAWITNSAQEDIWGTNAHLGKIEIANAKTVLDVIKGWQTAVKEETA
jgi:hypothetical protein